MSDAARFWTAAPHSIPLVALGTGLALVGWYGFNAGSEFGVDSVTAVAFLNTDVAASFAAVTWLLVDWWVTRQPKFLGLLTGAVAGLATITPAAGYVSPNMAVLIGVISGVVCYAAVALKNKLKWDDALDVWGRSRRRRIHRRHLASESFANRAFNPAGVDGLLTGGSQGRTFFFMQCLAVIISSSGLSCSPTECSV